MKRVLLKVFIIFFLIVHVDASENKLNFSVFVSDDVESFDFSKTKREYIYNERASAIFLVSGFTVDESKKVNLTSEIKVMTPEKKFIGHLNRISLNRAVSNKEIEVVLDGIYDLYFENGDKVGTYWLNVTIKDNIANISKNKKISILLFDNEESKRIIMSPVRSIKHLDELWKEYFRTKNPWAIKRVISVLNFINKEGTLRIIGNSAKFSLESNARQYEEVLEECKKIVKVVPLSTKEILTKVIFNAEQKLK